MHYQYPSEFLPFKVSGSIAAEMGAAKKRYRCYQRRTPSAAHEIMVCSIQYDTISEIRRHHGWWVSVGLDGSWSQLDPGSAEHVEYSAWNCRRLCYGIGQVPVPSPHSGSQSQVFNRFPSKAFDFRIFVVEKEFQFIPRPRLIVEGGGCQKMSPYAIAAPALPE